MEELTKALLRIDSNDAVIVADKYIAYKYVEIFTFGLTVFAFISVLCMCGFLGYRLINKAIDKSI